MGLWTELLSNGSPPYAMYRALNACRQLAASKQPSGVRPLECRETWMRLVAGCNNDQSRGQATIACGNAQLCAGLRSGIEGNLHAVRGVWPQSAGWTHDGDISGNDSDDESEEEEAYKTQPVHATDSVAAEDPLVDAGADEDETYSRYEPGTGYGAALYYVLTYVVMAAGAFGMVILLSRRGFEAEYLSDFKGLNTRSPWFALMMMFFMFGMAGVPPWVGFFAKLNVINAVLEAGFAGLAILMVLASVVGAYYYLRVVWYMYFDAAEDKSVFQADLDMRLVLSLNGVAVLLLGIMPGWLLKLCFEVLG